ncbi:MAG: hypothetical protein ABI678_11710 [Kofleriaceae bacterium]
MSVVVWSTVVGGLVLVIGLVALLLRGDRERASGLDKLFLLGPIFYAAPLAGFGTEHFTLTAGVASLVPSWIPYPEVWTYAIGAGFIAAALSMVTGILARVSASLVAATMFVFVVAMDVPAWAHEPSNRIAFTLALRELAFCGGALAIASSHIRVSHERGADIVRTIARYFIAVPVLVYSVEQFLHGDQVPGVPLARVTPTYIPGHALWTYLAAAIYAVGGGLLLVGRRPRAATLAVGAIVLVVVLVVYVPIAVVEGANLTNFNFIADTLMFGGAVLAVGGAIRSRVT